jgi:hypothetical protein
MGDDVRPMGSPEKYGLEAHIAEPICLLGINSPCKESSEPPCHASSHFFL